MIRILRLSACAIPLFLFTASSPAGAQAPPAATAPLRELHVEGFKILTEAQILSLTELQIGSQVGKEDLQAAADRLVKSGLFSRVNYSFQTHGQGVSVTYHVEESPRIPAYFDNIPWFADSELADAIRKKLPFFDGTLPEAGGAVDQAAEAVNELLTAKGLPVSLEHLVIASPVGEGNVQEFRIEGAAMKMSRVEFSDTSLSASRAVQQHLSEILGKPYSRMTIDLFLTESIRPIYLQQGYLRAKLGPPEVRLTGNPNQKLPDQIPVYIPVTPGGVYHWKGIHWTGNTLLSEFTLTGLLGAKPGDVADGLRMEAGWDRIREEYGHHGYLDAKLEPVARFDDEAHTVSYTVSVQEGVQYHYGKMILTGLSLAGERKVYTAWTIASGNVFDKAKYEDLLQKLQLHQEQVFGELPVHYDAANIGHWLQTDPAKTTVDILLDFK
jgi:outer membrane protein assembly factor BamA